jgi:hypothetical protein
MHHPLQKRPRCSVFNSRVSALVPVLLVLQHECVMYEEEKKIYSAILQYMMSSCILASISLFPYGIPCAVSACNGVEPMEGRGTLPDTTLGCAAILLVWRTAMGATYHDRWISRAPDVIMMMIMKWF